VVFVLTTIKRVKIHPMNYLFVGAAYFSFHLLLAHLVDHVSIHAAFLLCSAVRIALVASHMRPVVGMQFTGRVDWDTLFRKQEAAPLTE